MLANDTLNGVAAEPSSTIAYEQRLGMGSGAFLEPGALRLRTVFPERRRSLLSSLAHTSHVRASTENDITAVQID